MTINLSDKAGSAVRIEKPGLNDIPQLKALWKEVFGDGEEFLEAFFGRAFSPERAMIARDAMGEILSALFWLDCSCEGQKIAYIYGVSTKPSSQGRGLCTALMTHTHSILAKEGYFSAILVPVSGELFGFYERLGYKTATYISEKQVKAQPPKIPVRAIGPREYAELRRKYLAPRGVLQEGVSLDFLEAQLLFFAGEGFVLVAFIEEDRLVCPEILGDVTRLPSILSSLGCDVGSFRMSGDGKPFTMLHKLSPDAIIPTYFGLAFD